MITAISDAANSRICRARILGRCAHCLVARMFGRRNKAGRVERSELRVANTESRAARRRSTLPRRALRAPPGGQPVGKTRMARAIGEARDRIAAAEAEVGLAGIAERPAAAAAGKLEQRAAPRVLDARHLDRRLGKGTTRRPGFCDRAENPRDPCRPPLRWRRLRPHPLCQRRRGRRPGRPPVDRPSRWILPMTALRVTPISAAIWLQVSPAVTQLWSCSMRSVVQVAPGDSVAASDVHWFVGLIKSTAFWAADRARGVAQRTVRGGLRFQASAKSVRAVMTPRSPSRIRASRNACPPL